MSDTPAEQAQSSSPVMTPSNARNAAAPLDESTVVRSIYLYAVCAAALLLIALGSVMAVTSAFRVIAPDAGHRDNIDRLVVGVSNLADELVDTAFSNLNGGFDAEAYCEGMSDEEECIADFADDAAEAEADTKQITDSVAEVTSSIRGEINNQIRWNAAGKLVAGAAIALVGFLVFRRHSQKVAAYR